MLNKIKSLPHKISFAIGFTLLLIVVGLSSFIPCRIELMIIQCVLLFIGLFFILTAAENKLKN